MPKAAEPDLTVRVAQRPPRPRRKKPRRTPNMSRQLQLNKPGSRRRRTIPRCRQRITRANLTRARSSNSAIKTRRRQPRTPRQLMLRKRTGKAKRARRVRIPPVPQLKRRKEKQPKRPTVRGRTPIAPSTLPLRRRGSRQHRSATPRCGRRRIRPGRFAIRRPRRIEHRLHGRAVNKSDPLRVVMVPHQLRKVGKRRSGATIGRGTAKSGVRAAGAR